MAKLNFSNVNASYSYQTGYKINPEDSRAMFGDNSKYGSRIVLIPASSISETKNNEFAFNISEGANLSAAKEKFAGNVFFESRRDSARDTSKIEKNIFSYIELLLRESGKKNERICLAVVEKHGRTNELTVRGLMEFCLVKVEQIISGKERLIHKLHVEFSYNPDYLKQINYNKQQDNRFEK